jgi:hypothetical protein
MFSGYNDQNEKLRSFVSMLNFGNVKKIEIEYDEDTETYNLTMIYRNYGHDSQFSDIVYGHMESDSQKLKFLIHKYIEIPNDQINVESKIEDNKY